MTPAWFGLDEADPAELAGDDAAHNAGVFRRVLGGEPLGPTRAVRNAACMTAGLALLAIGAVGSAADGAAAAGAAIDDGRALATLEKWIAASHAAAGAKPTC